MTVYLPGPRKPSKSLHDCNRLIIVCFSFLAAPVYYYFYKRATLRISDPRFFEDLEWDPSNHITQINGMVK